MNVKRSAARGRSVALVLISWLVGCTPSNGTFIAQPQPPTLTASAPGYSLIFQLSDESFGDLDPHYICLTQDVAGAQPAVWLSIKPLDPPIGQPFTVTWGAVSPIILYETQQTPPGAQVLGFGGIQEPASLGTTYSFSNYAFAATGQKTGTGITVINNEPNSSVLGFGLLEGYSANTPQPFAVGFGIMGYQDVAYRSSATFTPPTSVFVFVSDSPGNTVLSSVPANALKVDFSTHVSATVGYDVGAQRFYLISSQ